MINKANSDFAGTVTSLLLHYPSMQVSDQAAKLVHHDIQITTDVIRANNNATTTPNILVGLILDVANCQGAHTHFNNLNLQKLDLLVFLPYDLTAKLLNSEKSVFWTCFQKLESAIGGLRHAGFHVHSPIQIDSATGSFSQDLHYLDKFRYVTLKNPRLGNWFHFIVEAQVTHKDYNNMTNETFFATLDIQGTKTLSSHHRRPFHKKYLGFSVFSQYANLNSSLLIPHIFVNFRKVIIELRSTFGSTVPEQSLINFVEEIATYQMNLVYKVKNYEQENILDDGIAAEIFLVVNVLQKDVDAEMSKVNDTLLAMKAGNNIFPGIIRGVLINYEDCSDCVIENSNSSRIRQNTNKMLLDQQLKLGIILNIHDCFRLKKEEPSSVLLDKSIFIVKINITVTNLEKSSPFIIPLFKQCKSILEAFYLQWHRTFEGATFGLFVKVYGCDGSTINITRTLAFSSFLEIINKWAFQDKTLTFVGTAFEDGAHYRNNTLQCFENREWRNAESCDCGWWKFVPNSTTLSTSGTYDDIENKTSSQHKLTKKAELETSNRVFWIWVVVVTLIVVVIANIGALYLAIRYRTKYLLTKREVRVFFNGGCPEENSINEQLRMDGSGNAQSQPYNKALYELQRSKFKIDKTSRLGSGEFGIVCKGTVTRNKDQVEVAVKTTKSNKGEIKNSHTAYLTVCSLISEIKILSYVGAHKHIVALKGVYTAKLKDGKIFMFLELCELGSLEKYLRRSTPKRYNEEVEISTVAIGNTEKDESDHALDAELSHDLSRWTGEIACGMDYLASKNVFNVIGGILVHADLATRNILLNSLKQVKISDFGLARRLYDFETYVKEQHEPLPWRWMAPESLRKMMFNEKTDVWMFGITLWEMYTLGEQPYPGLSWQIKFPAMLERGLRLPQPKYNEKDMFSVMKRCWDIHPDSRPAFSELKMMLASCCVNETTL